MIKNPRRLDGEEIKPVSLSIDLNITPLSTATLTLPAGEQIAPRTYIELFALPGSMGVFRARSPQMGAAMNTTVQLDHAIAEVGDSLFVGDVEQESTVSSAMTAIWGHYKGSKWQLGSVAGGSTAVVLKASYDTVLDAILDVLEQAPSLMLAYDFSTTPWTVSVAQRETTVTAEGRLSRNVKSASVTVDDSDLYTRVYMDKLPGTSGNTYGHIDADTISLYGIIETELSGAETAAQATRIANAYLEKHKNPIYSVDIEGIDLSQITGETLDSFALGRKYRLALPQYGVVVEETITAIRYNNVYGSPNSISITLSEEADQVISYIKKSSKGTKANSKAIIKQKNEFSTKFDQTEQQIILWAGKTDTNDNILQQAGMYLDAQGIIQYATDNEHNIGSVIQQTASSIRSEVHSSNSQLYSVIEQTSTNIMSVVANVESGLQSEIEQTQEMIRQAVWTANSEMYSVIEQTASQIMTDVGNTASDLQSQITQTAESISTAVSASESTMYSAIEQTATQINQTIANTASGLQTNINQQADRIGLVVQGTGANAKIKAAEIVAAFNEDGTTQIKLAADHIDIDGLVSALEAESLTVGDITSEGSVTADQDVQAGGTVSGLQGSFDSLLVGEETMNVANATVSGNTLTITYVDGTSVNFSKAAPVSLSGSWSGSIFTVSDTGGSGASLSETLAAGTGTGNQTSGGQYTIDTFNSSHKAYGYVNAERLGTGNGRLYTFNVDASGEYSSGVTAGKNAVTITKGSWSAGQISFTKSEGTASTKSVSLVASSASWSSNTATVQIWDGTAADAQHGSNTGYTVTVDASARYNAGVTAGKNAVTITKGSWSGGQISFTKSEGTASTKSVQLVASSASWSGNTATVQIWDGTAADAQHGSNTGYTVSVDASARYNAGGATAKVNQSTQTIGYGASVTVKAQYVNASGTTVDSGSSCTITAPADNKGTGWTLAVGKVSLPGSGTSASMSVTTPGSTYNTSGSTTYTVSADNDYAYIKQGTTTVARASHSAFANGKNAVNVTGIENSGGYNNQNYSYWWSDEESGWYINPNIVATADNGKTLTARVTLRIQNFADYIYDGAFTNGKNSVSVSSVGFSAPSAVGYAYDGSTWPGTSTVKGWYVTANLTASASNGASKSSDNQVLYVQGFADYMYGAGYDAGAASVATYPYTKTLYCTGSIFSQSQWTYTFTYTSSTANMFTSGHSYKFHNNSGYT